MERLSKIVANDTPVKISDMPKVILHVVPLTSFSLKDKQEFHIPEVTEYPEIEPLKSYYRQATTHRLNFDGFLRYSQPQTSGHSVSYAQLFRNGIIETVECSLIRDGVSDPKFLVISQIERAVLEALARFIPYLNKVGFEPPFAIMLSLIGVKGMYIPPAAYNMTSSDPVDRDELILPEVIIDDSNKPLDLIMKPSFDAIWNAAGLPCSRTYDNNGRLLL